MDSDSDDDNAYFGTPLETLEEGSAAKRRPPAPEDQTVRDSRGRQRFHGAFTGGFSAGFFNTVGSKDGFQPASFVSSRSARADRHTARPDDFMDDEDRGEHGIAPQRLQARPEFRETPAGGVKRRHPQFDEGPIPGEPVLEQLLRPARDTAGVRILKAMGWRPGQGIGPRISRREKKRQQKVYGCARPPGTEPATAASSDSDSDSDSDSALRAVLLAPDDSEAPLVQPKLDQKGLGYRGLERRSVLGPAAGDSTLRYRDKAGKLAIRGQAFGVGAFENEDEDIYVTDDMSNYDFESAPERRSPRPAPSAADRLASTLSGFRLSETRPKRQRYPPPPLPADFIPRHRGRASRFEPLPEERRGLERHRMNAEMRAAVIGERPLAETGTEAAAAASERVLHGQSRSQADVPVSQSVAPAAVKPEPTAAPSSGPGQSAEETARLAEVHRLLAETADSPGPALRPFASDPEKQMRYEQFLKLAAANRKEDYRLLLPASMTAWEREREVSEFQRSALIFRPLAASLADRFISAGTSEQQRPAAAQGAGAAAADEASQAARRKMFGMLTRSSVEWHPAALLCRRFNVKNPFPHSSAVGTLGPTSGASATPSSAPAPAAAPPAAETPPPAPRPRLRWDDVLGDGGGGGGDRARTGGDGTVDTPASALALPSSEPVTVQPAAAAAPAQKPPADLFKAIFDCSDTESEPEQPEQSAPDGSPGTPPEPPPPEPEPEPEPEPAAVTAGATVLGRQEGSVSRPTAAAFFDQAPAAAKRPGFSLFDNVDLDELNNWRRGSGGGSDDKKPVSAAADPASPPALAPATGNGVLLSGDEYGPRLPPRLPEGSSSRVSLPSVGRKERSESSDRAGWREKSPVRRERKKKHKREKKKKKSKKRYSDSDSSDSSDVDRTLFRKLRDVLGKKKKKKKSSSCR